MANSIFTAASFDFQTLTSAINVAKYRPSLIAQLKLFSESGIPSTKARIERRNGVLNLVPTSPRGAPGSVHQYAKRDMVELNTVHMLSRSTILGDSVQDVRAFGISEPEAVQDVLSERLSGMRADLEATNEYHRIGAIKGLVLDASGATILDLFAEFDVTQQVLSMDLATTTTSVRNKVVEAKRLAEEELGDDSPKGWIALCSASFIDALLDHPSLEKFSAGWSAAEMLREDKREGVSVGGVEFREYRGKVGSINYIAAGEAYLVPKGVPDLLISRFAPADYADSVNTRGLPLYARAHELPFNRGVALEAQSNPLHLCTRPRAIIKLLANPIV